MRWLLLIGLVGTAAPLAAQTEGHLRRFFEGRTVVALLDMPGTENGVDVYPGTAMPVDFPRHAARLKQYGTAIRRGEEALITKLRVKKDLIEFQLGGGGYGTFWDDDSPDVAVPSVPKSEREKNLEEDLKSVSDPAARRRVREELDGLKREREQEEARLRTQAEQARQAKIANIRQRRLEGGSRFNLRYRGGVPADEVTPDAVMRALGEYLDFSALRGEAAPLGGGATPALVIRRGMTETEVTEALGLAETMTDRAEGSLRVTVATYRTGSRLLEAWFVEGILVRYSITADRRP